MRFVPVPSNPEALATPRAAHKNASRMSGANPTEVDTDDSNGVALCFLTEDDTADLAGPYAVQFIDRDDTNIEAVVASGRITFLRKQPVPAP